MRASLPLPVRDGATAPQPLKKRFFRRFCGQKLDRRAACGYRASSLARTRGVRAVSPTLLLLSPELSAETREGILTALTGVVERENGVMEEVDHWGMRDLAYPVRKQMRGYYVRLVYQAPAELVAELERNVRITDGIFKFVTVKLAEEVEVA